MSEVAQETSAWPLAVSDDAHRDRHLQRFPDARRHAPAHQLVAVAHRTRLGVALVPTERFRALAVAIAQALAAVRPVGVLVAIRIAPQAQLQRIELERDRQLVHRAFERIDAGRGAWSAHVARRRKIEPRELVRVFRVGALVEQAGPAGLLPMEVLVLRRHRDRFVRDRVERSAGICAELRSAGSWRAGSRARTSAGGSARDAPSAPARAPPARPAPPDTAGAARSRTRRP